MIGQSGESFANRRRRLDYENDDYDLQNHVTVLTHTPSTTVDYRCSVLVKIGDGTKDLTGAGGNFEAKLTIGGNSIEPCPQTIAFGANARAGLHLLEFGVPAGDEVTVSIKSPNVDADEDVKAYLWGCPVPVE